jgi:predicted membrane protein
MLISRFKGIAYSPIFLSPLVLILVLASYYFSEDGIASSMFIVSCVILILWVILIYYMLNSYFISIKIHNSEISIQSMLGKGKPRSFAMNSIDGYEIQQQSGETNSSEVIFIYQNGKIVLRISELFYQNYKELKKLITQKLKRIPNR